MSQRQRSVTPEMREIIADNMRERIYSSITLLAVMAALWQNSEHHTYIGTMASIFGAAVALWLATLIAIRMSYRAVHGKAISRREYSRTLFAASGLLAPAAPPVVLIAISWATHLYDLKMALGVAMAVGLVSLFLLSFAAGRKIYDNKWRLLLVSFLEMAVGIGVILLKLAVGE